MSDLASLPRRCRETRERLGLSLREAAQEIGYAYADLCRFESGKKQPRMASLVKIDQWVDARRLDGGASDER